MKNLIGFVLFFLSLPLLAAPKIISLSPTITEILFDIGAGNQIIGTVAQSDYPIAAKKIPRVGGYADPDAEKIITLNPNFVITSDNELARMFAGQVKPFGIKTIFVKIQRLMDIPRLMRELGKVTAHQRKANKAAKAFIQSLAKLKKQYQRKKPVRVFFLLWPAPMMTVSDNTPIGDVITLCGGKNIFRGLKQRYPTVDVASVVARNPEVIFVSNKRAISQWKKWKSVSAVKNRRIYYISPNNIQQFSSRMLKGAKFICETLAKVKK